MAEKSLTSVDLGGLAANREFFPSPTHWEDEVVYFLMLDRFSDGKENAFLDNNATWSSPAERRPLRRPMTGMRFIRPLTPQPGGMPEPPLSEETWPGWNRNWAT